MRYRVGYATSVLSLVGRSTPTFVTLTVAAGCGSAGGLAQVVSKM